VVLFYLIVDHRAAPDERQGNLSCIFTTPVSPETIRCSYLRGVLISANAAVGSALV
jgi:hypothetical protein